jgi:MoaA/NifB/PqqE/SkfB family radical SAM enzyme
VLSVSREELEVFTRPLCSPAQWERKRANYDAVESSYARREERCGATPVHLHVEATADCNLTCPICPTGRGLVRRAGHLPYATFARVLATLGDTLANIVFSGWGEPLLNDDTPRMIALAKTRGVAVFLNTNGTRLEERAAEIVQAGPAIVTVSLDGAGSKPTHAYSDAWPFEKVVRGVRRLREVKDRARADGPQIHGKFILTEQTVDEIEALTRWASDLGVEHVKFKRKFRTMPGQLPRERFVSVEKLRRVAAHPAIRSDEDLGFTPAGCTHPWDSIFLAGDGRFGLCSWDPQQVVELPTAETTFDDVWNGPALRRVRRAHGGGGTVEAPCAQCNRLPGYLRQQTLRGASPSVAPTPE